MKRITEGTRVRMNRNKKVPVRYHGRSGYVVGKATSSRGAKQLLIEFPGRRATPLAIGAQFLSVL